MLQRFLPRFNQRFAVPPADPTSAYRPPPAGLDVATVCCLAYTRSVAADNTVSFGGRQLQLQPGPQRASYARLTVEVRKHLDGGRSVTYHGETLAVQPAPATAPVLRARKERLILPDLAIPWKPGPGTSKPGPHHPWRTYPLTKSLSS